MQFYSSILAATLNAFKGCLIAMQLMPHWRATNALLQADKAAFANGCIPARCADAASLASLYFTLGKIVHFG